MGVTNAEFAVVSDCLPPASQPTRHDAARWASVRTCAACAGAGVTGRFRGAVGTCRRTDGAIDVAPRLVIRARAPIQSRSVRQRPGQAPRRLSKDPLAKCVSFLMVNAIFRIATEGRVPPN